MLMSEIMKSILEITKLLFPLNRSLTGKGNRETFSIIKKTIFLKILVLIFILYSSYILVFISIYVARIYQNSFRRPNAYLIKKNSRLQTREKND